MHVNVAVVPEIHCVQKHCKHVLEFFLRMGGPFSPEGAYPSATSFFRFPSVYGRSDVTISFANVKVLEYVTRTAVFWPSVKTGF